MSSAIPEKPNILYVDDEEFNLSSFKAAFRRYYTIFIASSAKEGLSLLVSHPIKLIISDHRMPEITGVEFLQKCCSLYPDPIKIILTGYTGDKEIDEAVNQGCIKSYQTKPWEEEELKKIIDEALELKSSAL